MARSFALKTSLFVSVVAISVAASGCSNGPPSDPEGQIEYVQDAISAPSGNVDATTMKSLGSLFTKIQDASSVFAVAGTISGGGACTTGSQTEGQLDVSCATEGGVTGSISFTSSAEVSGSEVSAMVTMTFDNVCNTVTNSCVSGDGVVKAQVSEAGVVTSLAFDSTITKDGASTKVFFGEEASVGQGAANVKIVLFDDKNDSYVFVANVGSEGISASVEGGNGSYACNLTSEGGSCSGDATFTF